MNRLKTFSASLLMATAIAGSAAAYDGRWSAKGLYENIIVTDCSGDCEEEIGIFIACRGLGMPAEIIVNAVGTEVGREGAPAPVTFSFDGQTFTRNALTSSYGMVGYTPILSIAPGDPLIEAMKSGKSARITFNDRVAEIGLKGSRSALTVFEPLRLDRSVRARHTARRSLQWPTSTRRSGR